MNEVTQGLRSNLAESEPLRRILQVPVEADLHHPGAEMTQSANNNARGSGPRRPAVFLDRDGVLIENRDDYVRAWEDVAFLPGARRALSRLARSDYAVVLISNQSAIGRGLVRAREVDHIHARLFEAIEELGGRVDGCYICPHSPDDRCNCRKPAPGLIQRAASDLHLDLGSSFFVGDAVTDMEAAHSAGVHGILVLTGRGREQVHMLPAGIREKLLVLEDVGAAVDAILRSVVRAR
jgi:D-glycero-D-manno-heptose 1,7-bisphosphate phosphatase